LNDEELTKFQKDVFDKKLQRNHITAFKEVLVLECDEYDETNAIKGVNFEAFCAFMRILIRKLKMEICWTVLRKFDYDDQLNILQSKWDDHSIEPEELMEARSFELRQSCLAFLNDLFNTHKNDKSQKFDLTAFDRVFATTETGVCPWNVTRETLYERGQEQGRG